MNSKSNFRFVIFVLLIILFFLNEIHSNYKRYLDLDLDTSALILIDLGFNSV
jgi:hypothetical protein